MIPTPLHEVAQAVGGSLVEADPEAVVTHVCSDSRSVRPGSLFVALAGERVDGHDFAQQARDAGAVGILGARPTGTATIVVENVLVALGKLALLSLGPVTRPRRRSYHRFGRKDHRKGPHRPGPRVGGHDRLAARFVQQRARSSAHGAGDRWLDPVPGSPKWALEARDTSNTSVRLLPRRSVSS